MYGTIFEAIDMRSFSSIWFWIMLATVWSMVSHHVLGVPYHMIAAARRQGGQAEQDLEDMVRINVLRRLRMVDQAGIWLLGLGCFMLTGLLILGWVYWIELAQALFLLGLPLGFVALLSLLTAKRIRAEGPQGEALFRHLHRHRVWVQSVAMAAIFVTTLWGMYRTLSVGVLGS
ncbi:component of SufBCD complex [Primorskyibacter flagellatus]|nr:component of SufBCD complex [Primorskyibacter flagellatus]